MWRDRSSTGSPRLSKGLETGPVPCSYAGSCALTFGKVVMFRMEILEDIVEKSADTLCRDNSPLFCGLMCFSFHSVELVEPFA